jgi:N-acetylglucosaminyl-diphospho-decaprenol L-rhamnosyltransferase
MPEPGATTRHDEPSVRPPRSHDTTASASVSVLVVSYNTSELLARCLRSVERAGGERVAEIIVVDNASTDGSADLVARDFSAVHLIRSPHNLGFAAGVNAGARAATSHFLLLPNPDTEIEPGAVDALVDGAARHPDAGLIGGRTLDRQGVLDRRSCWGRPTPWSLFCFGTGLSTLFKGTTLFDPESLGSWARDTERTVGAISGAFLLVERTLWTRLGGFDEDYFMYSEDIDLASRARAAGRTALVVPGAVASHVVGASSRSSGDKMVLVMTGKATYFRKSWSPIARRWGLAMLWSGTAIRAALERLVQRRGDAGRTWSAVWAARRRWLAGYRSAGDDRSSSPATPTRSTHERSRTRH